MRINEILLESDIKEGPKFNKFGKALGNVAGMAAKGAGAVAGGIAGLGAAAKKGFQAGKAQVSAGGDRVSKKPAADAAQPDTTAQTTAPSNKGGILRGIGQGADQLAGTKAFASDKDLFGKSIVPGEEPQDQAAPAQKKTASPKVAAQPSTQTTAAQPDTTAQTTAAPEVDPVQSAKAEKTLYSQIKAQLPQLDKKGKQRIRDYLDKQLAASAAPAPQAAPEQPAAQTTPAKPEVVATNKAPRVKKPVNITTAGKPVVKQPTTQVASKENKGNIVAEGFSLYRKQD